MLSGGVASPTDRIDSIPFSDDEVGAAVQEAAAVNRYVTGHAYTARAVNRGLRLGAEAPAPTCSSSMATPWRTPRCWPGRRRTCAP